MIKKIIAFWMIGQLLFGSLALPLGDFSLVKELPRMYQAYVKVVEPDEKGVFDFIGDYLLDGKDLLGHNRHDQPSKPGAIQFQGSPIFAVTLQAAIVLSQPILLTSDNQPQRVYFSAPLSDYHSSLFRPPLA